MPGWGTGLGSRLPLTRQGCANKCDEKDECLSFEHSNDRMLCNLNKISMPSKPRNRDYIFCKKLSKLVIDKNWETENVNRDGEWISGDNRVLILYSGDEREALPSENESESIVYEKEGQLRLVDGRDETEVR